jgi:hypothetical protein
MHTRFIIFDKSKVVLSNIGSFSVSVNGVEHIFNWTAGEHASTEDLITAAYTYFDGVDFSVRANVVDTSAGLVIMTLTSGVPTVVSAINDNGSPIASGTQVKSGTLAVAENHGARFLAAVSKVKVDSGLLL